MEFANELRTAQIFSNNMVLQRNKQVLVWGTGKDNTTIEISIANHKVRTMVRNNQWRAEVPCMEAGGPYVMSISDGEKNISYENVMVGEVWYAGGQSNMELELQNCKDGAKEVESADWNSIRFYNVAKIPTLETHNLEEEGRRHWEVVKPTTAATMSAVAYFFAREVSQTLGITVGIIDCYWGGTSISCWMSREYLSSDEEANTYILDWNELVGDKTDEEYEKEKAIWDVEWKAWNEHSEQLRKIKPDISWEDINKKAGICPWPEPAGKKSGFRPGGLYETMVQRVAPYTIKGFLWYQGEEDEKKPKIYDKMLTKLISQWRSDWSDDELPFVITQLPMWIEKGCADTKSWAILRENQRKVSQTIKNTALAVLIDCGEYDNIHPLDKKTVGHRLALQVLEKFYNINNLYANSPMLKDMDLNEDNIVLYFDYVYGGFEVKGNDEIALFEIAGEDEVFYPAKAVVNGESIIISNAKIKNPKYARYAWTNYGIVNLYNIKGLPVAPFVTV
ncbi:sialate O-acetylesterase [Anaeromicropila populeti]|nr:sialate O-acetylesterase [Anaeromicropila populeti]